MSLLEKSSAWKLVGRFDQKRWRSWDSCRKAASIPLGDLLNYEARQVLNRNLHLRNSTYLLAKKIRHSIHDDYSVLLDRRDVEMVATSPTLS